MFLTSVLQFSMFLTTLWFCLQCCCKTLKCM